MSTKIKTNIISSLRWAVFIMAALSTGIRIAEVSANETLKLLVEHPELCEYSSLVHSGYLILF